MAPLRRTPKRIKVGNDPALNLEPQKPSAVEHRGVSLKWLLSTVVTGFASTGLMIGALYAAVDGRQQIAVPPNVAQTDLLASLIDEDGRIGKGDRLTRIAEPIANRQLIDVSTIHREGDMDVVRLQPFVRVIATLALESTEVSEGRPPFNPLNLFAGNDEIISADAASLIYDAEVEGEIAVRETPFPFEQIELDQNAVPTPEQVAFEVADIARFTVGDSAAPAVPAGFTPALDLGTGGALAFADPARASSAFASLNAAEADAQSALDALESFDAVRVVPENFSIIGKVEDDPVAPTDGLDEVIVALREGDTLGSVLIANGSREGSVAPVETAFETFLNTTQMREGHRLRIAMAPADESGETFDPIRVSLYDERSHLLTIALTETGRYQVDEEPRIVDLNAFAAVEQEAQGSARIYSSIYETALANDMSMDIANELIQIFAYDLDYQRVVQPGDTIEVLHELDDDGDASGDVVFASITTGSTTHKFYRFTAEDGSLLYFDEDGVSANKFLIRNPVPNGRFRSAFGMRRHPILGYSRMHNGVDWSAPRGTPIIAAGNGTVTDARWNSGFGRWIRIEHANGYVTSYAHQSRFADGIAPGVEVRQGQVIGYIGSTGLSTGPHLHYEVLVNGRNVDPMGIRVAREETLSGQRLIDFERERDRIDQLMERDRGATIRVASSADF
ncbi:M23 family metallopeptidase [Ahrensia marina]|uniref:M23 family metallopeptidase n=1 Tax=Ahrensia marina TaxID=1514904 RepID=UPI0035D0BA9E